MSRLQGQMLYIAGIGYGIDGNYRTEQQSFSSWTEARAWLDTRRADLGGKATIYARHLVSAQVTDLETL